jgi:periplasmic protein TonB
MFADSLCESASNNRSRRGWITLASFGVQALAVGVLLTLPFWYTQSLPQLRSMIEPIAPPSARSSDAQHQRTTSSLANGTRGELLVTPPHTPDVIEIRNETAVPPAPDLPAGYGDSVGADGRGSLNPVFGSIGNGTNPIVLPPPPSVARQLRPSRMMEGNLIYRVQPMYPLLARQARIQGTVLLRAVISREGTIENLHVVSGSPMLVPAAIDAVRQWRYRPYFLNDQALEVETQVTVIFVLSGG